MVECGDDELFSAMEECAECDGGHVSVFGEVVEELLLQWVEGLEFGIVDFGCVVVDDSEMDGGVSGELEL